MLLLDAGGGSAPTPSSGGAEDVFTITLMRRGTDNGNTSASWFAFGFASLGHACIGGYYESFFGWFNYIFG